MGGVVILGWSCGPAVDVFLHACLQNDFASIHFVGALFTKLRVAPPPPPPSGRPPRARAVDSRSFTWRIVANLSSTCWHTVARCRGSQAHPAAGRSLSEACKYIGRMTPRLSQQGETMHLQNTDSFPFLCRSFWRALVQCRCGANLSSSSSRRLPQGSLPSLGSRPTSPAPICPTITITASPAMAELNISQVMARCIGRMAAAAAAAARTASRHAPEQRPAFSDHHPTSPRGRHKWQNAALTSGSRFEEANMRYTISLYLSDDLPSSSGHAFDFICVLIPLG